MKKAGHLLHAFSLLLLLLLVSPASGQSPVARKVDGAAQGLVFTENKGQILDTRGNARPDILYIAQTRGFRIYMGNGSVHYVFDRIEDIEPTVEHDPHHRHVEAEHATYRVTERYRMDMELVGANPKARIVAGQQADGLSHFYIGHAPDGIRDVRSWRELVQRDIYPHIDMVMRIVDDRLKCEFVVHPGGDPSQIRMKYTAADRLERSDDGSLRAITPLGILDEEAPFCYVDDPSQPVTGAYRIDGETVSFDLAGYDRSKTLVIDPIRKWSTFYGGNGGENLNGGDPTEVDRNGNVLVAGFVDNNDNNSFPVTTGAIQTTNGGGFRDAIFVKFDGNGRRLWATYYGGNNDEIAHGVVADPSGNVFLAGHTASNNFPVQNAYQSSNGGGRDAFVVKLDSNGARIWATYYGGSDFDDGYGFGGDSTQNVAVLITSGSTGMATPGTFQPVKPSPVGDFDALLVKFSAAGGRVWATYYGGSSTEYGYAVGTDPSDNIIITGWTFSNNFPTTAGAFQVVNNGSADAYIVKLNRDGVRLWGTYYGGNGTENDAGGNGLVGFAGLATDGGGTIFITGYTTGGTFPVSTGAFQTVYNGGVSDGFIVKMNPNGLRVWATFVGGSGEDVGTGIASNPEGGVLATGYTASTNFPVTAVDAYQRTLAGTTDAYILKLNRVGIQQWGTYYGGTGIDEGHGISFDPYGSMVVAGHTNSGNFPTLNPHQGTKSGGFDMFALLFCDPSKPFIDSLGTHNFCAGDSLVLWAIPGYSSYRWSNGSSNDTITIKADGDFFLTVTSVSGCIATSDTVRARVRPRRRPVISPAGPYRLCLGDTVTLDAGVALSYRWSTGETTQKIRVTGTGDFKVYTTDLNGCRDSSELMSVAIFPKPDSIFITPPGPHVFCEGDSVVLTANSASGPVLWSTGATTRSITVRASGTYRAYIDNPAFCFRVAREVTVKVNPRPRPTITLSGSTPICQGDSVTLTAPPGYVSYRWSNGRTSRSITVTQIGNYVLTVTDTNGCTGTSSELINVVPRPSPVIGAIGATTFCEGDSVTLVAEPGQPRYLWSNGLTSRTIVVRDSGTYTVQAGEDGCLGTSNAIKVVVKPRPASAPSGAETVCPNKEYTYSVPLTPGATYVWTVTGQLTLVSGQGTNSIVVRSGATGGGTISLAVNDPATQCNGSGSIAVRIGTTLNPRITASIPTRRLCPGSSMTLDAGANYRSYLWSTGDTTRFITVRDSGNYTVTVSDGSCTGPGSIRIDLVPPINPVIGGGLTRILCPGDSIVLDAGVYTSYRWSNNAISRRLIVRQPGTYWISVTNSAGCRDTSEAVVVTAGVAPRPVITGSATVCSGSEVTYCVQENAGNTYEWDAPGGTIINGQGTRCITVRWGGGTTGSVSVRESQPAGGCSGVSPTLAVSITSNIAATISADGPTTFCSGDSVTLTGPEGFDSYQWTPGGSGRSIVVRESGTYRLTVTSGAGCSASSSVDVIVGAPIDASITPPGPVQICEGQMLRLSARPGYASYRWSNGMTTPAIDVTSAGLYSVVVRDAAGCEITSQPVQVMVNPRPDAPSISRRGDTLTSTPAAAYQWMLDSVEIPGATSQTFVATSQGEYRVRITDANGCSEISPGEPGVNAASLVMLPVIEATPGERLSIPLSLVSSRNLDNVGARDYILTLSFNRTLLLPTGATPIGVVTGENRVITLNGRRDEGITTGPFATLEFIAALGDTIATPLVIERFEWVGGSVNVGRMDGEVRIKPNGGWKLYIPDGRLTLLPPQPNPVANTSEVELVYETIEPGITHLYIVDMLGRRVATVVEAELLPTRYRTRVDIRDFASGNYYVVLQTPTERLMQLLQIEK